MGKFLGIAASAVALVAALACGGSSSTTSATSTGMSYKGAIDGSIVASTSDVVVAAYDANGKYVAQGSVVSATAGEDHVFMFDNLAAGAYTVKVMRLPAGTTVPEPFGSFADIESQGLTVLSTVAIVNSTSGADPKRSKSVRYRRQINPVTTYIANSVSSPSANLQTVIANLFGAANAGISLDEIESVGGAGYALSASAAPVSVSGNAQKAIEFVSIAASLAATASSDNFATVKAAVAKTVADIVSAGDDLSKMNAASAGVFTAAQNTLPAAALAAFEAKIKIVAPFIASVLEQIKSTSGGVLDFSALSGSALDTASTTVETNLASATEVSAFELAKGNTYGSNSGSSFVLTSLAPVFKLTLKNAATLSASDVTVTLKNVATGGSVSSSVAATLADVVPSSDSMTYYFYIKKSASTTLASKELKPGTTYEYSIYSTKLKSNGSFIFSGTMTTTDVTVTYPYTGSQTSVVMVNGNGGVSGTSVDYYIHSKNALTVNSGDSADYGFFGSNSYLNASFNAGSATGATLKVSSVTTDNKAGVLSISGLSAGSYDVSITKDQGLKTAAGVEVTSYPTRLMMDVK